MRTCTKICLLACLCSHAPAIAAGAWAFPARQDSAAPSSEMARAFALARSFYPELAHTDIRLEVRKAHYPYSARPKLWSLVGPKKRRAYRIVVSKHSTALREPTLLHNLSFEQKVGALGHELADIAQYERQSGWAIAWDGIRYATFRFKRRLEHHTDRVAIEHGLGRYILAWCRAVYPIKQRDGRRGKVYCPPDEIERMWHAQHIETE